MNKTSSQDLSPLEFFKVYIPSFSSQKLLIPVDFVTKYKGIIPNKAILKDHTGRSWNINIVEVGSDLFFTKGWQDFVHDKFLDFGDFLIFRFNRISVFYVKIFGRNGCKKEERPKARVKMEQNTILEPTMSRPSCGSMEEDTNMVQAPSRTNLGFQEEDTDMEQAPKHAPSGTNLTLREEDTNMEQTPKQAPNRINLGFREEDITMEQAPKQAPSRTNLGFKDKDTNMEHSLSRSTRCCKRKFSNLNIKKLGKLGMP